MGNTTLFLFKLEGYDEIYVEYDEDFLEGDCPREFNIRVIDKEAEEKFKENGIDVRELYKKEISLNDVIEDLDEEKQEEIKEILNSLDYFYSAYTGEENIYLKKDFEDADEDDNLYYIDNCYDIDLPEGAIVTKKDIAEWLDLEYELYYEFRDSNSNYRCVRVESITEIKVSEYEYDDECDDEYDEYGEYDEEEDNEHYEYDEEDNECDELIEEIKDIKASAEYGATYHYEFYETEDGKVFGVIVSYFQGELPKIDKDFGDWEEIENKLLF